MGGGMKELKRKEEKSKEGFLNSENVHQDSLKVSFDGARDRQERHMMAWKVKRGEYVKK